MNNHKVTIIGAGLAGSEAAWILANLGIDVELFEMRPQKQTGAHTTDYAGELVCSNSLGSNLPDRASGVLKNELRTLNSLLMKIADETALPAGGALAVDRINFAQKITDALSKHSKIKIFREEKLTIPDTPTIIASGPLTSESLAKDINRLTGSDNLYFFDAIAPIINRESIDLEIAFRASRYERGEQEDGDYINCPFNKEEFEHFVNDLIQAQRIELKNFEKQIEHGVNAGHDTFFEGCLPIEILASRGLNALAFGPLRPVGLWNPHTNQRPYAVLQLRQDNLAGDLYNMVGFQTNLTFSEQKRIFRLIPGLASATFARYGQMHRNTFIASPNLINASLQLKKRSDLFFAGQLTGVEGYVGNIATGLIAGLNMFKILTNQEPYVFPKTTMIGALLNYITNADLRDFQPMKANFGILPPLENKIKNKRDRFTAYATRSKIDLENFLHMNRIEL